jgi:hypothetical protein
MINRSNGALYNVSAKNIPMFLEIIFNLIVELRKALKVNMTTDSMEVKMHISYVFTENRFNRFCISVMEATFTTVLYIGIGIKIKG